MERLHDIDAAIALAEEQLLQATQEQMQAQTDVDASKVKSATPADTAELQKIVDAKNEVVNLATRKYDSLCQGREPIRKHAEELAGIAQTLQQQSAEAQQKAAAINATAQAAAAQPAQAAAAQPAQSAQPAANVLDFFAFTADTNSFVMVLRTSDLPLTAHGKTRALLSIPAASYTRHNNIDFAAVNAPMHKWTVEDQVQQS